MKASKHLVTFASFLLSTFTLFSAGEYKFSVDLTKCVDDKLSIELIVPEIKTAEVIYSLPKMVPGTYEIYDFGRFVSEIQAFDGQGAPLLVEKIDKGSWKIKEATKLNKITYRVEDTWDTNQKEGFVFEPGGSNFESNKNFVLNAHCLFGYFEGMTKIPYRISITRPSSFYGSTSLTEVSTTGNTDVYTVPDYALLQDAPIMYNVPDTTVLNVGGAKILISVYSPNKITTSGFISENIKEILIAQKEYLGGSLPIKKYAYLIYLSADGGKSGSSGALEHSYSSMYFLPEMDQIYLAQTIKDVSAHEFFHIVTPLNIHAEQIGEFDYSNPRMSEHLWLYEGVTEYASGLVQVKYGNMSVDEYLKVLDKKIATAKYYNDTLPFTKMSLGCLDEYKDQYGNVYQKGALIGLCLDVKLRSLSDGKYGIQELMADLSKTYGKDRSFKDDELFGQIVKLTYPEIGDFFTRYVAGSEPLPIVETMKLVGIEFGLGSEEKEISFGGVAIGLNPATNRLMLVNTSAMDDFGKAMGYKEFDELIKFNGKTITLDNAQAVIGEFFVNAKEGDVLKVVVGRKKSENSKVKKVKLKSKIFAVTAPKKFNLTLSPTAETQQLKIRASWMGRH
ncbi:MAG: peptidase M61 [Bacteroidota bacterium]|nr:peptidase M61 [Bacteroidota bacterium]